MDSVHFLNGNLVSEKELLISPRDLGYARGYGVFVFLITYKKHRPFMLERHVERLFRSAEVISLSIPWSKEVVSQWVIKTLDANKYINGEKVIRISISGGPSFTLSTPDTPTIVITVDPAIPCPAEYYENGVAVRLVEFQRYQAEAKTTNYIEAIRNISNSNTEGIDELIYHSDGMVREGSRCNIFAVMDGRLLTPKTNILQGVTRGILLDILELSAPVIVEDFSVNSLLLASEVFIAATAKDVMPVTNIDDVLVGNGEVGIITTEVMKQLSSFIDSDLW